MILSCTCSANHRRPAGLDTTRPYLLPGIFAQTVVFNSSFTGVGLAEDLSKGLIDRLRSLPMVHSAVLIGRTVSDLVRNVLSFTIMFVVAILLGFRVKGTVGEAVAATLLLLFFSYAFSWIQALIGLSVRFGRGRELSRLPLDVPLTFVSSAFVETSKLPGWLQVSPSGSRSQKVTNATRALYNRHRPGAVPGGGRSAWAAGITMCSRPCPPQVQQFDIAERAAEPRTVRSRPAPPGCTSRRTGEATNGRTPGSCPARWRQVPRVAGRNSVIPAIAFTISTQRSCAAWLASRFR